MIDTSSSSGPQPGGCGGGHCGCGGQGKSEEKAAAPIPMINGIAVHDPLEEPDDAELLERAWGELLRQEAVRKGLLPRQNVLTAPLLQPADKAVIESMIQAEVPLQAPDEEALRRYYQANRQRYMQGRQVNLRHILFAVTEGVDVHALAVRAENALLELLRRDAPKDRFASLAAELSNCPSGADGGMLGWIAPEDCAEELANELFSQKSPMQGLGVHPRLVHTRFGFHIVDVLGRRQGRQLPFEEVRDRIAVELAQRSRATALHQYIRVLAGKALVEGIDLEGAESPLVQ